MNNKYLELFYFLLYFVLHLPNFRLKNMRKKLIIAALFFLGINTAIRAQVTIGSDTKPVSGSLLDVKENAENDANATKGIMLPRVKLSDINNLYPMFGSSDSEYSANKTELDRKHIGLMVYNLTESTSFKKGLYYWDGTKWVGTGPAVWSILGNTGTDSTENYIGTTDNQPLVLKANKMEGLRITPDGAAMLANVPDISSAHAQVLVRSKLTGKIGVSGAVPTKLMLVQSGEDQSYKTGSGGESTAAGTFNNGGTANARPVLWKSGDIGVNNIVTVGPYNGDSFEYFIFQENGLFEVSGFILYEPNCKYNIPTGDLSAALNALNSALAGVNVAIQKQAANGTTWDNIAATRTIWSGPAIAGTSNAAAVPPTTESFKKNDKIRLVFYRPSSGFGEPHGTGGGWGITFVNGIDIRKGMRVTMVEDEAN
jgi:hypothetical protein